MNKRMPELIVGAGSMPCAIAAVRGGADAVFFGIKGFNMRDLGTNFKLSELSKLMKYLHENKVKGYLALNTIIYDSELKQVDKILAAAKKAKVDAIIVSDLGVLSLAKKYSHRIHLSTQASVSNSESMKQFAGLGVKRIVLARELSLKQIAKIKSASKKLGVEIECFVHGAMCISVSGRCFLSHDLFGRSANRGECLQPCRRAFFLDGSEPNYEKKEVYLDGHTVLSAKDLKAIDFLDKVIETGVDSLKIEGRTKPADYVFTTAKCYREAVDSVHGNSFSKEKVAEWNKELSGVYNRGFSSGFYFGEPSGKDLAAGQGSFQTKKRTAVGFVTNYYAKAGVAEVRVTSDVKVGDTLIFEGETTFFEQKLSSMEVEHQKVSHAIKGAMIGIKVSERVRANDKVFAFREK